MPKLIYANTKNTDMFYTVKVNIPDAFLFLDTGQEKLVFLDHREIGVFKEKNKNPEIKAVLLNTIMGELNDSDQGDTIAQKVILKIIKQYDLTEKEIEVPVSLQLDIADFLRKQKINIVVKPEFYSERIKKTKQEILYIKDNVKNTIKVFKLVENILSRSEVKNDKVLYEGKILTSEYLKFEVEKYLFKDNMICSEGFIISSGEQTVMPHHTGSGEIKANVPIICDIFPKDRENGYFADMTRTYVVGKASEKFKKMYNAVLEAQIKAIDAIKPGIVGKEIHEICVNVFKDHGFDTGDRGFIHGTGHGIGLDLHEAPYINSSSDQVLEAGHIFTIEPGLYYEGIGGVRIEDDILVTDKGYENLIEHGKELIEF